MEINHKISSSVIDDMPILVIAGDMTSEADNDVMKTYATLKDKHAHKNMIINFEKTNYINSAGIATLINIIQDMGDTGGRISFVGLSDHFQKVMDIVGISDFVDIFNKNNEALAELKKRK